MILSLQSLKTAGMTIAKTASRGLLYAKKYSPTILTVAGIASGIAATVVASIKSTHVKDVLEEGQEKINDIRSRYFEAEKVLNISKKKGISPDENWVYSEDEYRKDLVKAYFQTTRNLIKLYWPAITLTIGSITCICVGHNIITKRAAALAAAYSGLAKDFESYRKKVKDKIGEEEEKRVFVDAITENDEKTLEAGESVKRFGVDHSPYCKIFDEFNNNYSGYPGDNFVFLKSCQNMANDLLHIRGHVFLNEVYDMLGFQHTKAGSVCGWLEGNGDNFIDFGIFDMENGDLKNSAFINGDEKSIILDFNVDGPIYTLLGEAGYH